MTLLTPQQKIDEIHAILTRQESRRKWSLFFAWFWRILITILVLLTIFFPAQVMQWTYRLTAPIVEQVVRQVIESQKNSLIEGAQNVRDGILERANTLFDREPSQSTDNPY